MMWSPRSVVMLYIGLINIYEAVGQNSILDIAQWKYVPFGGNFMHKKLEPCGVEVNSVMYLCRATMEDGNVKIGSLWNYKEDIYCRVNHNQEYYQFTEYDILEHPPGAVSWAPLSYFVPSNAVGEADSFDGYPAYACRGVLYDDVLVGSLHPYDLSCYVTHYYTDVEVLTENIEILVVNNLGLYG